MELPVHSDLLRQRGTIKKDHLLYVQVILRKTTIWQIELAIYSTHGILRCISNRVDSPSFKYLRL